MRLTLPSISLAALLEKYQETTLIDSLYNAVVSGETRELKRDQEHAIEETDNLIRTGTEETPLTEEQKTYVGQNLAIAATEVGHSTEEYEKLDNILNGVAHRLISQGQVSFHVSTEPYKLTRSYQQDDRQVLDAEQSSKEHLQVKASSLLIEGTLPKVFHGDHAGVSFIYDMDEDVRNEALNSSSREEVDAACERMMHCYFPLDAFTNSHFDSQKGTFPTSTSEEEGETINPEKILTKNRRMHSMINIANNFDRSKAGAIISGIAGGVFGLASQERQDGETISDYLDDVTKQSTYVPAAAMAIAGGVATCAALCYLPNMHSYLAREGVSGRSITDAVSGELRRHFVNSTEKNKSGNPFEPYLNTSGEAVYPIGSGNLKTSLWKYDDTNTDTNRFNHSEALISTAKTSLNGILIRTGRARQTTNLIADMDNNLLENISQRKNTECDTLVIGCRVYRDNSESVESATSMPAMHYMDSKGVKTPLTDADRQKMESFMTQYDDHVETLINVENQDGVNTLFNALRTKNQPRQPSGRNFDASVSTINKMFADAYYAIAKEDEHGEGVTGWLGKLEEMRPHTHQEDKQQIGSLIKTFYGEESYDKFKEVGQLRTDDGQDQCVIL